MEAVGVAIRWLHAVGFLSLVGAFGSLVLVARPAARAAGDAGQATVRELDGRLLAIARGALVLTIGAGVLDLWRQVHVATGVGLTESLEWGRVQAVLLDTRYGVVWLARTGLLLLLGTLLLLGGRGHGR